MTEPEWVKSTDTWAMLEVTPDRLGTERKLRLFACACCRRIWERLSSPDQNAVLTAEEFADGRCGVEELASAHASLLAFAHTPAQDATRVLVGADAVMGRWDMARAACWNVASDLIPDHVIRPIEVADDFHAVLQPYQAGNAVLLREIFGNPFRPVPLNPSWLTPTAVSLAWQMYDSQGFSAMPVLGDALQDAGCDSADILDHCRGPGPHVRGCWVVDLVLGKE